LLWARMCQNWQRQKKMFRIDPYHSNQFYLCRPMTRLSFEISGIPTFRSRILNEESLFVPVRVHFAGLPSSEISVPSKCPILRGHRFLAQSVSDHGSIASAEHDSCPFQSRHMARLVSPLKYS
jgi:hypothetical protein